MDQDQFLKNEWEKFLKQKKNDDYYMINIKYLTLPCAKSVVCA